MTTRTGRTGHIAWHQHGENPRMVLLHGFSDAGMCWDPIIPGLGGVSVVTVDARGHGESGLPEEEYGAADQAADATSVIEDLGLRDVVVMGHSMGGSTALVLADARPDLVKALILEDPSVRTGPSRRPTEVPESFRQLQAMSLQDRIAKGRAENPTWPEDEYEPWARSKGMFNTDVYGRRRNDDTGPTPGTLRGLSLPVLLIHGDVDRGSIVKDEVLAAAGPNVRAVHIAGVGHSIRRENRAAFLEAVNAFGKEQIG